MTPVYRTVDRAIQDADDAAYAVVKQPSHRPARAASPTGRTSVALLTGRHETAKRFEPLAIRLALDGHATTITRSGDGTAISLGEIRNPDVPFVLLGSDTGALRALVLAGSPALRADGLVLLGLPLLQRPVSGEPLTELPPRALPDMPILLIHGDDDQISPLPLARMLTRTAPRAELAVVPSGHGVLRDSSFRWAAARILLFLETLIHSRVDTGKPT